MKALNKDTFYYMDNQSTHPVRIWHTCDKYKNRDVARVELSISEDLDDSATYKCNHCEFEYVLDKTLNLR